MGYLEKSMLTKSCLNKWPRSQLTLQPNYIRCQLGIFKGSHVATRAHFIFNKKEHEDSQFQLVVVNTAEESSRGLLFTFWTVGFFGPEKSDSRSQYFETSRPIFETSLGISNWLLKRFPFHSHRWSQKKENITHDNESLRATQQDWRHSSSGQPCKREVMRDLW